ncbi:MAG TPA: Z1 domain-containing protein, partial [Puia sp.]|nr:Z1 domain-containing protein [Puia sp.]
YYVRHAVTSQMDTMHQHARMFGYREVTLHYTKLFTTLPLYYRFCDIYSSDQSLRTFIEQHVNDNPNTFPIDTSIGLRPTRKGVLDYESVEAVGPGMQIYPNRMKLPQQTKTVDEAWDMLFRFFNVRNRDQARLESLGKIGVLISIEQAKGLLSGIKTLSQNSWHDKSIQTVLTKLSERLGSRIRLKYRPAERTILEDGIISSGTLSGAEQDTARRDQFTTLWIMDVTPRRQQASLVLPAFIFPTIVVPRQLPRVFVFSKK